MKIVHGIILCAFVCPLGHAAEPTEGLAGRYRQEAASAQAQGRPMEARNAWYKYLAAKEREPGFAETDETSRIRTWLAGFFPAPAEPPREVSHPPVAALEKKIEKPARLSAKELAQKAELLYKSGQLDESLRFYRLAAEAEPSSTEIQAKIQLLEKEMN
jgi:hypothetical protein